MKSLITILIVVVLFILATTFVQAGFHPMQWSEEDRLKWVISLIIASMVGVAVQDEFKK